MIADDKGVGNNKINNAKSAMAAHSNIANNDDNANKYENNNTKLTNSS